MKDNIKANYWINISRSKSRDQEIEISIKRSRSIYIYIYIYIKADRQTQTDRQTDSRQQTDTIKFLQSTHSWHPLLNVWNMAGFWIQCQIWIFFVLSLAPFPCPCGSHCRVISNRVITNHYLQRNLGETCCFHFHLLAPLVRQFWWHRPGKNYP